MCVLAKETMKYTLPELPYELNALSPVVSPQTMDFHYNKHLNAYKNNLNTLLVGSEFEEKSIENIIQYSTGPLFNNAAQYWNHIFYFYCLSPNSSKPSNNLLVKIEESFGSFENFKKSFSTTATSVFGSGWAWLSIDPNTGKLAVDGMKDADTPLKYKKHALLACDVWEHAYYLDYKNERPRYVEAFWDIIDWNYVSSNLDNFYNLKNESQ